MLDKATVRQIAKKYANVVCETLSPKAVVLFGSYVNGNPHEYSDIDIAVVFDGYEGNWFNTSVLLQELREGIDDDALAGIEPHMMDTTSDRSGFLEHIMKNGEIIYTV
jgi:predicted nucleotidyltransferase